MAGAPATKVKAKLEEIKHRPNFDLNQLKHDLQAYVSSRHPPARRQFEQLPVMHNPQEEMDSEYSEFSDDDIERLKTELYLLNEERIRHK